MVPGYGGPRCCFRILDASSYMKDVRKTQEVGKIFARILEKHGGLERGDAVALMEGLNGETLRLARVRLDIVCMMLWRRLCLASLQAHSVERTHVFLFADASPQHGAEAFCSSCDLLAGDRIERRMLPVVSLSRPMLGATGKSFALMWQTWLAMAGPSMATFSIFCGRVRSITTDLGVERKMVDCPNITEEFFALVNRRAFGDIANAGFLFPRAVCVPGWKHMVDNLLRSGLNTLRWFPSWLAGLKATVGFVRSPMNKEAIVKHWRRRGLVGLAETFSDTQIVGFADWRWNTLCIVCRGLTSILNGLVGHFDPTIFANGRNPAELSRMLAAIRSES